MIQSTGFVCATKENSSTMFLVLQILTFPSRPVLAILPSDNSTIECGMSECPLNIFSDVLISSPTNKKKFSWITLPKQKNYTGLMLLVSHCFEFLHFAGRIISGCEVV